MTAGALSLILVAAVLHATWNLLAKRSDAGPEFVWLVGVTSVVVCTAPLVVLFVITTPSFGGLVPLFLVGTALLHLGYYLTLQRGYQAGDLSLVYPLARGTGPVLAMIGAVLILDERPSLLVVGGAGLIAVSVLALAVEGGRPSGERATPMRAVMLALLTGLFIASYSLWDKYAVSTVAVSPLMLVWASALGRGTLLAPRMWARRRVVRDLWARSRREIIAVGVLDPLAYLLVLVALRFTPVSHFAPAREISILFGILIGSRFLGEQKAGRRLSFGGVMVLGVIALAVG